jgi:hypoxanthine phosphoribosyltransferase
MKPSSIEFCCLLNKYERREKDIEVNYIGFNCPNEFVIGYGMDASKKYRNLPFIGIINN